MQCNIYIYYILIIIWYYTQSSTPQNPVFVRLCCVRAAVLFPCFFGLQGFIFMRGHMNKPRNGTPYYISPEVWEGEPFTTSSDVWSMGCILFEICALQVPFPGNSAPEIAKRNLGPVSFRRFRLVCRTGCLILMLHVGVCLYQPRSSSFQVVFYHILSVYPSFLSSNSHTRNPRVFIHFPFPLRFHPSASKIKNIQ